MSKLILSTKPIKQNPSEKQTEILEVTLSQQLLNSIENAILNYSKRKSFINNPYHWFSEQLGYKHKNFLYEVFEQRNKAKLGFRDVKIIYGITKDEELKRCINQEFDY